MENMARLRVSAEARRDLRRIGREGTRDHGAAASATYVEGFRRLFRLLREHPFAGQERPEIDQAARSLSHRPYRIIYRIDIDAVVIVRIVHQSRDTARAMRQDH